MNKLLENALDQALTIARVNPSTDYIDLYAKQIVLACIEHIESCIDPKWQINYKGGWEAAAEELKKIIDK